MATVCSLDALKIREITSVHSNASARQLINDNFRLIKDKLVCIGGVLTSGILIQPPVPPQIGVNYVVQYTGSGYILVPQSQGIKYRIRENEKVYVGNDYQYIVHQHLINLGEIEVEGDGELVIL